jgi:hypothetical protein
LLYGRKAITPLDLALSSTINAEEPPYEQQLQVHIDFITNKLQQVQLKAQQNIETAQQKQKERHDEHVKETSFHIGDKVLLYRSAQAKVHGDKFREKWKGPYYIHNIVAPGAYKLRSMDDKILKGTINANRLKLYFDRPLWEPTIVIS